MSSRTETPKADDALRLVIQGTVSETGTEFFRSLVRNLASVMGTAGSSNITNLYSARYGLPKAGTKVYVQVNQVVDGWESLPRTYSTIGPAAS
jgi:hypothetical protein